MSKYSRAVCTIVACLFLCFTAGAQSNEKVKRYDKDGLSFNYPADMTLVDQSQTWGQHLILSYEPNGAQIMVLSRYEQMSPGESLKNAQQKMVETFVQKMIEGFKEQQTGVERSPAQVEIGGLQASGVRLRAVLDGLPGNAEVYSQLLGNQLVMVALIGSDKAITAATTAWNIVRSSLQVSAAPKATAPQTPARLDVGAITRAGKIEGSTYTNSYFGLTLPFPSAWEVQDDFMKQTIMEKGKETLAFDDSKKQAQLEQSVSNSATLFMLFEKNLSPFRAGLGLVAEKVPEDSAFPAADYIKNVIELTKYSKISYVVEKPPRTETINGVTFAAVDFIVSQDSGTLHQKYYVHVKNGYALCFILTSASEGQTQALRSILEGVRLT